MSEYGRTLGEAVRTARLNKGLTQIALANMLDLDVRTIINIENYKGNPKMEVLYPLIRALDINPNTIFFPEQYQNSDERSDFNRMIAQFSNEEIASLRPICRTVVSVLRAPKSTMISENQNKEPAP